MYMKVWINKEYLPAEDLKNYTDSNRCIQITIDKVCKLCNVERKFYGPYIGSKDTESSFGKTCIHSRTYEQIYAHRVQSIGNIVVGSVSATRIDSIDDGMKCSGVCRLWCPMASANQKDGTFKCWSCRTRVS